MITVKTQFDSQKQPSVLYDFLCHLFASLRFPKANFLVDFRTEWIDFLPGKAAIHDFKQLKAAYFAGQLRL